MFKLVVLSALLALAAAKPSYHTALVAPALHSAYVAPAVYAAPAAVSHQSRVDIHSAPVHAVVAAPVHSAWAAPVHSAWAAPIGLGHHTPAVVLTPHGVPLETADVVAAKAIHFQAKALAGHGHYIHKRSIHAPLAYTAIVAPSAVSHQSRVDVHSAPVVAAPIVSYAAPYVSHAYAAPVAHYPVSTATFWGKRAYGIHAW